MRRITRSMCGRLRRLRSRQDLFVSFPVIAFRNSIPPGPPAPEPTIPPPPPQPELPPEEPPYPDAPTPTPGLPPFPPQDPTEPEPQPSVSCMRQSTLSPANGHRFPRPLWLQTGALLR